MPRSLLLHQVFRNNTSYKVANWRRLVGHLPSALPFPEYHRLIGYPGSRFLPLLQAKEVPPPMHKVRQFSEAIEDWRASLPPELEIALGTVWNNSNIWIIVIHALSYHLEAIFYHIICKDEDAYPPDLMAEINQQRLVAIFEWGTLFRRAMVHDLIQFLPPWL